MTWFTSEHVEDHWVFRLSGQSPRMVQQVPFSFAVADYREVEPQRQTYAATAEYLSHRGRLFCSTANSVRPAPCQTFARRRVNAFRKSLQAYQQQYRARQVGSWNARVSKELVEL